MTLTQCRAPVLSLISSRAAKGWWTFVSSAVVLIGSAVAQENESAVNSATAPQVEAQPAENEGPPQIPQRQLSTAPAAAVPPGHQKRKKALAGLMAVAGIAVFGVGAIAITMLWARRLRRLARDPGPEQKTAGNDFWFLKPPKQPLTQTAPENQEPPENPPSTAKPPQ